jgi:RimJ/RimL family protein N-acetyltransferase
VPALPHLDQPLSDGVVVVRRSAERDIPEVLIAYQDDPGLHRGLGEARPPSGAELGRRSDTAEFERLAGTRLTLTIARSGSDVCCGEVRIQDVDWDAGTARFTAWTAPAERGQDLARPALDLVRSWLRSESGLDLTG